MKNKKEKTKILEIGFGVLDDSISLQLLNQGFNYELKKVGHFQKIRECITHLMFAGMLSDKQRMALNNKLFKKIERHVKKHNHEK